MDDLLKEMRADIKTILINQATMAEKQSNHSEEMHEHKLECDSRFTAIRKELLPLKKVYWGMAFVVGAIPVAATLLKLFT
jgi:hypothetical protein